MLRALRLTWQSWWWKKGRFQAAKVYNYGETFRMFLLILKKNIIIRRLFKEDRLRKHTFGNINTFWQLWISKTFAQDNIKILDADFVTLFSKKALSYYKFSIIEKTMLDDRYIYVIDVKPSTDVIPDTNRDNQNSSKATYNSCRNWFKTEQCLCN